ncbi:sigma-70 family RNA polymerase sigma factor [Streptomyces glomeratus]|nr:sigma-70 family RNA polymerase sigma factor [Streptomyces glomeratus]MCF1508059.1 sigma-70 family RNA polymerase sigma factor [Streptomyces glomeratus]
MPQSAAPAADAPRCPELAARFEREALPFLDRLYAAAVQLTGDRAAAEHLVQDTCLRALEAFGAFTGDMGLKAWLFRVLADTALVSRGGRHRPPHRTASAGRSQAASPTIPALRTPAVQALSRLPDREVKAAIGQLPRKVAIVVHLADVEEFSYCEIAEILGVPLETVTSRLYHGRRQMLRLLTDAASRRGLLDPGPT